MVAVSGECNADERASNLIDGNENTKWCDVTTAPNYVVFDLGKSTQVSGWSMINAGVEDFSYITRTCLVEGRNSESEDWKLLDMIDGNRNNVVNREFKPTTARYNRLYVISPCQSLGDATRIYEFGVY